VQLAGGALGGNNAFLKQTAGTINFLKMPVTAWTLAARLRVGYIIPSSSDSTVSGEPIDSRVELIPTEDRYLLGGANTVRGYDQDELDGVTGGTNGPEGGLASILAGVEARFPLFWRLSGVFFLDAGNVWQDRRFLTLERLVPHQDRTEVTPYDLRYSYGMGIRFNTALGPIRIDYARKWNRPEDYRGGKDAWHVALGHAF
jgi:outer membrane protein insertion porin family